MLLNPILLTIALLIIFLKMTNISYDTYNKGGHLIEFWLKPAVVALGFLCICNWRLSRNNCCLSCFHNWQDVL